MTARPLDRNSPMPLWAQLESELRRRLDEGEFDATFPTDLQLTETYEVSRHTVREAVRHLNKTGLLKRERGKGTVVNKSEFEQSLGTLYTLFQAVESRGVEQHSKVLTLDVTTDAGVAAQLEMDEETDFVFLERLRLAGDSPLAVDRVWMPLSVAEPMLKADFSHTALYLQLEAADAPVPNQGWERLTPIIPTAGDRELLGLNKSDAAFYLERLGCHNETRIEWRTTVLRGDRFRFVSDWSKGRSLDLKLRPTD